MYSGERVEKISPRVEAYGTIDEFNSTLGVAKVFSSPRVAALIEAIQERNFFLASELATAEPEKVVKKVDEAEVTDIEKNIDGLSAELPPAEHFVIPGGTKSAAFLHLARTVLRRAERQILHLAKQENVNPVLIKYVNRLSDYIFVLARYANIIDGGGDLCISRDGTFMQKKEKK